jgi:hypothetical protein
MLPLGQLLSGSVLLELQPMLVYDVFDPCLYDLSLLLGEIGLYSLAIFKPNYVPNTSTFLPAGTLVFQ